MISKKAWLTFQKENKHLTVPILSFPAISLLDVTVEELIYSSDLQAKGMEKIFALGKTSAQVGMMDLSVEAEAFKAGIKVRRDEQPAVISHPLKTKEEIKKMEVPAVGSKRTKIYIEAIKKAKKTIKNHAIFAGSIGPFTLAGNLMGMTEIMTDCYLDPETVEFVLEKTTEFIINYLIAFKEAGANGILLAEPLAGLLSPEFSNRFSLKYVKKIIDATKDDNFVFIYHNCGNVITHDKYLANLDADVFHFGNAINLKEMIEKMPKDKLIMGNINPTIIRNEPKEVIYQQTTALLKECSQFDNFIISTGCDIPPDTSWDKIATYFQAIEDFYLK